MSLNITEGEILTNLSYRERVINVVDDQHRKVSAKFLRLSWMADERIEIGTTSLS